MTFFQAVPAVQVVSTYRRQWLLKDVIAGVVLTTLLVPQGMANAQLAGLPPITGLFQGQRLKRDPVSDVTRAVPAVENRTGMAGVVASFAVLVGW